MRNLSEVLLAKEREEQERQADYQVGHLIAGAMICTFRRDNLGNLIEVLNGEDGNLFLENALIQCAYHYQVGSQIVYDSSRVGAETVVEIERYLSLPKQEQDEYRRQFQSKFDPKF